MGVLVSVLGPRLALEQEAREGEHAERFGRGSTCRKGMQLVKNVPANAGGAKDVGLILGSGRSPGGGNGNPLQYSCLGNPMDRGAWQPIVYGVTKSWT